MGRFRLEDLRGKHRAQAEAQLRGKASRGRLAGKLKEGEEVEEEDQPAKAGLSKYGNVRSLGPCCGGFRKVWYASKKERDRALVLEVLREAGEVCSWLRQVRFDLPREAGMKRCGAYVADFVVLWADGHYSVEDAKGCRTEVFKRKKRAMLEVHGLEVQEL